MKNFDIITVGACIIDAFLTIHEANLHCRLNQKECELCIRYGEKIQVDKCDFQLGGNACNVAVGLSRLGLKSSVMAEIGDDEFAQKIVNGLKGEGVSLELLRQTRSAQTSFAIGIEFQRERTLFVSHVKRTHDFKFDDISARWMYLTSLGQEWRQAYQQALEFVKKNNVRLVFNPGSPQFTEGPESFSDVLKEAHILIVNKTEAQKIVKTEENDMNKLIVRLLSLGPKIVVITDGVNGSVAVNSNGELFSISCFPVSHLVAKTGAGDAYATGLVAALMLGLPLKEAMRWGAINASSVLTRLGAQEGLLTRMELMKKLGEHPEFQARESV